jgi:hypothetical protein
MVVAVVVVDAVEATDTLAVVVTIMDMAAEVEEAEGIVGKCGLSDRLPCAK